MIEWKNITTYSRSDKEKVPTTWEIKDENLTICVTCDHINYKGLWVMHCRELNIDTKLLDNCKTLKQAKKKAIDIVINKLQNIAVSLDYFSEE